MRKLKPGLIAMLLFLTAHISTSNSTKAEEYPYSGFFSFVRNDSVTENLDRRCALSFIHQEKDGTWQAFHLDLDKFKSTQEISYLQVSQGRCTFEPTTRLELCKIEFDTSYREQEGLVHSNLLEVVEETRVQVKHFDSDADYIKAVETKTVSKEGYTHYFHRCPQSAEVLTKHISPTISPLTEGEIHKLRSPDRMFLLDPVVVDASRKLGR